MGYRDKIDEKLCNYFYPNQTFTLFPNQAINKTLNLIFVNWLPYIMKHDETNEKGEIFRYKICGPLLGLVREFILKAGVK